MPFADKLLWIDGDFTIALACGLPRFSQPFTGDKKKYILEQDFTQFVDNFVALNLNTNHPSYPTYKLVEESPLQDQGGGIVKWTRTYAAIPDARDDYSTLAYNYIGYYGTIANIAVAIAYPVIGRNRFTEPVTCRIRSDYFLCAIGQTYPTPASIPVISAQLYYVPLGTISGSTFTSTYPAGSTNDILYGTQTDFLWDNSGAHAFPGAIIPTRPTRTEYQTLINNGTEIVAESSQLSRWEGNIYQRVTKYVLPE